MNGGFKPRGGKRTRKAANAVSGRSMSGEKKKRKKWERKTKRNFSRHREQGGKKKVKII